MYPHLITLICIGWTLISLILVITYFQALIKVIGSEEVRELVRALEEDQLLQEIHDEFGSTGRFLVVLVRDFIKYKHLVVNCVLAC